jgi:hypothetical protein
VASIGTVPAIRMGMHGALKTMKGEGTKFKDAPRPSQTALASKIGTSWVRRSLLGTSGAEVSRRSVARHSYL